MGWGLWWPTWHHARWFTGSFHAPVVPACSPELLKRCWASRTPLEHPHLPPQPPLTCASCAAHALSPECPLPRQPCSGWCPGPCCALYEITRSLLGGRISCVPHPALQMLCRYGGGVSSSENRAPQASLRGGRPLWGALRVWGWGFSESQALWQKGWYVFAIVSPF